MPELGLGLDKKKKKKKKREVSAETDYQLFTSSCNIIQQQIAHALHPDTVRSAHG